MRGVRYPFSFVNISFYLLNERKVRTHEVTKTLTPQASGIGHYPTLANLVDTIDLYLKLYYILNPKER